MKNSFLLMLLLFFIFNFLLSGWQEKSDYIFAARVGRKGDHFS